MVLSDRQMILLDDYNDMSFVYSIMCERTYNFYRNLKFFLDMPILITSCTMSIINSNVKDQEFLKIANIVCNILIGFFLATNNFLKIGEKKQNFKMLGRRFTDISNRIEEYKILNKISKEFVNNTILQYDSVISNIEFEFPEFIKQKTREQFKLKRTLPPIINNIKKLMENRDIELTGYKSPCNTGNNSPSSKNVVPMRTQSTSSYQMIDNIHVDSSGHRSLIKNSPIINSMNRTNSTNFNQITPSNSSNVSKNVQCNEITMDNFFIENANQKNVSTELNTIGEISDMNEMQSA